MLLIETAPQGKGNYKHNSDGDLAQPYSHDAIGDL